MGRMKLVGLLTTATTISAALNQIGDVIMLESGYDWATINLGYTKGDEASLTVYPTFLEMMGGVEAQWMDWTTAAGVKVRTLNSLSMTATGSYMYTFDVRGKSIMRFFEVAVGGTPTGTLFASVTLKG